MRKLLLCLGMVFFGIGAHADQAQEQAMQQAYEEFVQIDAKIEGLVKEKLHLKGEIAQHKERESSSIRPRVERRQNSEIEGLLEQMQTITQQISELEAKRSSLLMSFE
jgi:hypothetical protein